MRKKKTVLEYDSLPKSREEALQNPCRVVAVHNIGTKDMWIQLSRPQSLEFDFGITVKEPSRSGELKLEY